MQTHTYVQQLERIDSGISLQAIADLLGRYFNASSNVAIAQEDKQRFSKLLLDAHAALGVLEEDDRSKALLDILPLGALAERGTLAGLIAAFQSAANRGNVLNNKDFWHLYYGALTTHRLAASTRSLLVEPALSEVPEGHDTVEIEIMDFGQGPIPTKRLIAALSSLEALYSAVSEALGGEPAEARVAFVDSGTNITVGLEGVGDAIRAVRELFSEAWNAIRFSDHQKLERDWETTAKGIEVLRVIRKGMDDEVLDENDAQRLSHVIRKQLEALVGDGVMLRDVSHSATTDKIKALEAVREGRLLKSGDNAQD